MKIFKIEDFQDEGEIDKLYNYVYPNGYSFDVDEIDEIDEKEWPVSGGSIDKEWPEWYEIRKCYCTSPFGHIGEVCVFCGYKKV